MTGGAFTAGAIEALRREPVVVTTVDDDGRAHRAPFSYLTVVSHRPPTLALSVLREDGKMKTTARNALATRALTIDAEGHRFTCRLERAMDIGDAVLLIARVTGAT